MKFRLLTAALILATSAPLAFANDTNPPPDSQKQAQATSSPQSDPDRTVCKLEKPIGSNIPTRTCKTAAQWQQERDNSRKFMQDMQRTGPSKNGG